MPNALNMDQSIFGSLDLPMQYHPYTAGVLVLSYPLGHGRLYLLPYFPILEVDNRDSLFCLVIAVRLTEYIWQKPLSR